MKIPLPMMIPTMTLTALNSPSVGLSDTLAAMMVAERVETVRSRFGIKVSPSSAAFIVIFVEWQFVTA